MNERKLKAERALVSTCMVLVLGGMGSENEDMLLDILRDLLPDCDQAPLTLVDLRMSADRLVRAKDGHMRGLAMARLRLDASVYCANAAGQRYGAWREDAASAVVEDQA